MSHNGHPNHSHSPASDDLLRIAVREAISRSEPIRGSGLGSIHVAVSEGKVTLSGLVGSEALRFVAVKLAAGVPGVESVEDLLAGREEVERAIASGLANAPETSHLRLIARLAGAVPVLYGVVRSRGEAETALSVARKAVHGLEVKSELRVVPEDQHVLVLEQHSVEGRKPVSPPAVSPVEESQDTNTPSTAAPPATPVEGMA